MGQEALLKEEMPVYIDQTCDWFISVLRFKISEYDWFFMLKEFVQFSEFLKLNQLINVILS